MRTGYQLGPISKFRMIMANETRLDLPWDACTDFYTLFISDHSHVNDGDHVVGCYLNPSPHLQLWWGQHALTQGVMAAVLCRPCKCRLERKPNVQ